MSIETIYVHPAVTDIGSRCRIYTMPYPMRPKQKPGDIAYQYQKDWREVGMMNHEGKLVYADPEYRPYLEEVSLYGGCFFEIDRAKSPD